MDKNDYRDEELLLMARFGHEKAREELISRYMKRRRSHARTAYPSSTYLLDDWDINHAFFSAMLSAMSGYSFQSGEKFFSYYMKVYGNSLLKEIKDKSRYRNGVQIVSLDEGITTHDEDSFLSDVIPLANEDPRLYVDYLEEAGRIGLIEEQLDPKVLEVGRLRLSGCTFNEIMEKLSITRKKARILYDKFQDYIEKNVLIS